MKTPFFQLLLAMSFLLVLTGCSKDVQQQPGIQLASLQPNSRQDAAATASFRTFVIEQGNHFCNNNRYPPFRSRALFFTAIFNQSAIYNFTDPNTLYDQNTLYGFADNISKHQQFSARFGWRWFDNQLQLAAYVNNFNDSTIVQIGAVPLNTEVTCGIVINGAQYDFYLNGSKVISLPRASSSTKATGYKLFPYFGGEAVAPHRITIKIREE